MKTKQDYIDELNQKITAIYQEIDEHQDDIYSLEYQLRQLERELELAEEENEL